MICLLFPGVLNGQICSCAGPLLTSNVEFAATPPGTWQFGLTYEYNSIHTLYTGAKELEDQTRRRSTQTVLLETSYGLTSVLSIGSIWTLVQKRRIITLPSVGEDYLLTRGIGDALLLLKSNLLPNGSPSGTRVAVGAGVKLPLGQSRLKLNGIALPPDMQPGSGSVDGLLWADLYQQPSRAFPLDIDLSVAYRFPATRSDGHEIGDEVVSAFGIIINSEDRLSFGASGKYRAIGPDKQFSESALPNTGGRWLFLLGLLNYELKPGIASRVTLELPVYQRLQGTQLSSTYVVSLSLFYTVGDRP